MTLEWYLITSGEIEDLRKRLQDVRRVLPDDYRQNIREISKIIDTVEDRFA
jgi:hypothetical protein